MLVYDASITKNDASVFSMKPISSFTDKQAVSSEHCADIERKKTFLN